LDAVGAGVVAEDAAFVPVLIVERTGGDGGLDLHRVDAVGAERLAERADLIGRAGRGRGGGALYGLEGGGKGRAVGRHLASDVADRGDHRVPHPPGRRHVAVADGGGRGLGDGDGRQGGGGDEGGGEQATHGETPLWPDHPDGSAAGGKGQA